MACASSEATARCGHRNPVGYARFAPPAVTPAIAVTPRNNPCVTCVTCVTRRMYVCMGGGKRGPKYHGWGAFLSPSSTRVCFGVCFLRAAFVEARATARRCGRERAGERATLRCKVAAIPLVTTHGSSARSATLTEHGATRIPELLRRLRRRGKCAWGSRGQGDGNHRPVVLCRPWGPRPPRPRSPQRPPRLLPASAAFQAGSRCVEVWFCLRMRGSALERHFQARGDGRAASRGGSGRRTP